MTATINYTALKQKYLNKIIALRNYNAPLYGMDAQLKAASAENAVFDISDKGYQDYRFLLSKVNRCCSELLAEVIQLLIKKRGMASDVLVLGEPPFLSVIVKKNEQCTLYFFKKYGLPTIEDQYHCSRISQNYKVSRVKYVSLVRSNAASYAFDHSHDSIELSLKDFFLTLFDEDEYLLFQTMEQEFTATAKAYLGHSVIKTLTPNALYSFKRYLTSYFNSSEFASLVESSNTIAGIEQTCSNSISRQFITNRCYSALIGQSLFAESLITAEWMYYSLFNADSVDLTIIALGYFKALEQILFEYIKLHSGEDRRIKRIRAKELENKPSKIWLNDSSIRKNQINTMLDSLITFFEDNKDLFNSELNEKDIDYIISTLEKVKLLRNGFFHKDNIEDSVIVKEVRNSTYLALYYMLGSLKFRESDKIAFSIPLKPKSEVEKLRDYMSYYAHKVYYIGYNGKPEYAAVALQAEDVTYDKYGNAVFSEFSINAILSVGVRKASITTEDVRNKRIEQERRKIDLCNPNLLVMEGEQYPDESGLVFTGPIKTIYENGRFLLGEVLVVDDF